MKYSLLSALVLASMFPICAYAQSEDNCIEAQELIYNVASLWPNGKKPSLSGFQCSLDQNVMRCGSLVPKKDEFLELDTWRRRLTQCVQASFINGTSTTINGAIHTPSKMDIVFRGQALEGELRLISSAPSASSSVSAPSMLSLTLRNKGTATPTLGVSKDKLCELLSTLASPEAVDDKWKYWRGIAQESFDGTTTYMCAKVPLYAKSRFDCELNLSNTSMSWAVRWTYPQNVLDAVEGYGKSIAEMASSCYPGTLLQMGSTRHQLHNPKMNWRLVVQSRQNDVGRGPSVELRFLKTP